MRLFRDLNDFPESHYGCALTIGNFDGVHRGHGQIIDRLKFWASQVNGSSVVFTFDPHPVRLLRPGQAPPPLTWTERKAELLTELGVDAVIAYPTNQALLELSFTDFFSKVIQERIRAAAMIEGPNFYFGKDRQGNVAHLQQLCEKYSLQCEIVQPIEENGELISSTRIRELVRKGDVANARSMLTQPYRIRGMTVHGSARGGELGFPTANLDAIDTLIPAMGVYAAIGRLNGQCWPAAVHIGPSPTFEEKRVKVEVHLLDFQGTLYGQVIEVDFFERLRGIHQFDSADELIQQLSKDVAKTREIVSQET